MTRELQDVFEGALHGRDPRYAQWLDVVELPAQQAAPLAGPAAG